METFIEIFGWAARQLTLGFLILLFQLCIDEAKHIKIMHIIHTSYTLR